MKNTSPDDTFISCIQFFTCKCYNFFMQKFRKLPIGIQSFENLRKNDYLYVDKTEFIYQLVETGKVYFLSRPRRFGKSLFLSTLKAFFEGKKDLFEGLKIAELEKDNPDAWKKYPVLYFDFNGMDYSKPESLEKKLDANLSSYEEIYGKNESDGDNVTLRFASLIKNAHDKTGLGVVVLVDEYDKSLLESDNDIQEANRNLFKGFFGNLKSSDEYLEFVFITGVTRFSKVSIFSDLNHLNDISLTEDFSTICGITEEEMLKTFDPEIENLAKKNNFSKDECIKNLEKMYDGYHFHENAKGVYNPFSLINAFYSKEIKSYWFSTGTPTFLIQKLKESSRNYMDFTNGVEATEQDLRDYRNDNPNPIPLFYQTGYLTIKSYDKDFHIYTLKYPNDEVKFAFIESLVPLVLTIQSDNGLDIVSFARDIKKGDAESIMKRFESVFAMLPYPAAKGEKATKIAEQNFQNVFYLVFTLLGQWSEVEVHNNVGRADCVLVNGNNVFIFEFKVDSSADEALAQIEDNGYAKPYEASGKKITKIGANFSTKKRNLTEWKIL